MSGRFRLAEHQKEGIYAISACGSVLIAFDPGLGKSATALMWLILRFRERRIPDALVICPASLVLNWEAAIEKMIQFEGVGPQDVADLRKRVMVRSFQKTYRVEKQRTAHRNGTVTEKRVLNLREDVDKRWGAIIIDESHCIGNHSSQQTKAALTLSRLTDHRILLSGTPVSGGGGKEDFSKLYTQIKFLDPGFCKNWTRFCDEYVLSFDRWGNPTSYDVPKCRRLLEDHAIAARMEDCFDMPGTSDIDIPCILAAKKPYNDMKCGSTAAYGVEIKAAGGQYPKMLQICSGSLKQADGGVLTFPCSKDAALADLLNGTDDAVVIFCNYRASIDRCESVAKKAGRHPLVFDGRSKEPTWKDFQAGKGDVLICQYQSGGVGIDLFRSHITALYEPCYSSLLLTQSLARTYRKGQTTRCLYYYLITERTVEARAWRTVRSGMDITEKMMTEWASKGFDL